MINYSKYRLRHYSRSFAIKLGYKTFTLVIVINIIIILGGSIVSDRIFFGGIGPENAQAFDNKNIWR